MRILDRQRYWAYLKAYVICFVALVGLYIVVDAFTNLDEFLKITSPRKSRGRIADSSRAFSRTRASLSASTTRSSGSGSSEQTPSSSGDAGKRGTRASTATPSAPLL